MTDSRSYPLLQSSGATFIDLVEARRGPAPDEASQANAQNAQ